MAQDKQNRLIVSMLRALCEKQGIDVSSFDTQQQQPARQERKLTPQEQDALNNAPLPKPDLRGIPNDTDGNVTVETVETVDTTEADDAIRPTERTSEQRSTEQRNAPAVPRSQGKK